MVLHCMIITSQVPGVEPTYYEWEADFSDWPWWNGEDERPEIRRPNFKGTYDELIAAGIVPFMNNADHMNPDYVLEGPTLVMMWRSLLREKQKESFTESDSVWKRNKKLLAAELQNEFEADLQSANRKKRTRARKVQKYWAKKLEICERLRTSSGGWVYDIKETGLAEEDDFKLMGEAGMSIQKQIVRSVIDDPSSFKVLFRSIFEEEDYAENIRQKYLEETGAQLRDDQFDNYKKENGIGDFVPKDFYELDDGDEEDAVWLAERLNGRDGMLSWAERMVNIYGEAPEAYSQRSTTQMDTEMFEDIDDLSYLDNDPHIKHVLSEKDPSELDKDDEFPVNHNCIPGAGYNCPFGVDDYWHVDHEFYEGIPEEVREAAAKLGPPEGYWRRQHDFVESDEDSEVAAEEDSGDGYALPEVTTSPPTDEALQHLQSLPLRMKKRKVIDDDDTEGVHEVAKKPRLMEDEDVAVEDMPKVGGSHLDYDEDVEMGEGPSEVQNPRKKKKKNRRNQRGKGNKGRKEGGGNSRQAA